MRRLSATLTLLIALAWAATAQTTYPYIIRTFAGSFPLGDGGPASSALLYYPSAAVPDSGGNLYILDSGNYRVRKVTADGRISTIASLPLYGYDMKRAADGSLYVSGLAGVVKISPSGDVTIIAGNGTYGFGGDGGLATTAQVGDAYGVAADAAGNVYFSDVSSASNRIRQVTPDGHIRTIAGSGAASFTGDNGPAASATFDTPSGVAVDSAGNIYVADYYNLRVRKFTVGGNITTLAGNGRLGLPTGGPATASTLGTPNGVFVDVRNNVYFTDTLTNAVVRVSPAGALTVVAGNFDAYSPIDDGPALSSALRMPPNASADDAGNVFVVDLTHRVRKVTSDGRLTTVAGRLHFAGDNGPAPSAILNEPTDIAFDAAGNAYIADGANYIIRKVTPAGVISTVAGKLSPGVPLNGSTLANTPLPYIRFLAFDAKGAMYLAGNHIIYKVAGDILTIYAGTGATGNSGDGGRATAATFAGITGMALNAAGDLYVADSNRVRVISADTGVINAFAGSGTRGRGGDGTLATSALFDLSSTRSHLAVDRTGNVYVADTYNYSVRMVDRQGIISTVVGNGTFGHADGAPATSAFSVPGPLAFDAAGNLYVASQSYGELYRLTSGLMRRIAGSGANPPADGAPALASSIYTYGMKIDANNDIYSVDVASSTVRKLILNSPTGLAITDGNAQTAQTGQALPKALKVQLNGRAGTGVSGVAINFDVKSGSARLSAASAQTDASGFAAVTATLGTTPGPVVITATAAGTSLPAVEFTATATAPPSVCSVPQPAIVSAGSAGDFGGSPTFASGSWLEIKGANLSQTTRPWSGDDFTGANAPTTLDGVTVTINGSRAFIGYISPAQINVQAPADAATGGLDLVVTTSGCASSPFLAQKAPTAGGLLAPSSFNIGGKQYIAALHQDGYYVGASNLIAGVAFRPAAPGDTITLYGIGFGAVVPSIAPGTIVSAANELPGVTIAFGSTSANVKYAGLAPNAVGLYQFNVVVPDVDGDQPIVVKVGGSAIQQTGWLTVRK
jgi:uncharacterized protein (TIGR03437 family)